MFLCRYLHDEGLRREINGGLNVVETWNSANGFISFDRGGEVASTVGEAPHVLDRLLCHQSGLAVEEHAADTGGVSDHVFGLAPFFGYGFAPRMRDLKDRRLHLPPGMTVDPLIAAMVDPKTPIDVAHAARHWNEMLHMATSVPSGLTTASAMPKRLSAFPRANGLTVALRAVGRLERSIFMLNWLRDLDLRRRTQGGLNKMGYPGGRTLRFRHHCVLGREAAISPGKQEVFMLYVGLDVSMKRTAVCVVDAAGKVVRELSVETAPEAIVQAVRAIGGEIERLGLEAGAGTAHLARGLAAAGLPAIVIDAGHASAALRTGFRNKTDKNDARGIADLMRVNKFRAVWVKSPVAQRNRALLTVREQLRAQSLDARNTMWSILQAEGFSPPGLSGPAFMALVAQTLDDPEIGPLLMPLASVVEHVERQVAALDRTIASRAKADEACKRLMTVPGVGPLVALTFASGVDEPGRFRKARNVGAHFGLTPRRFQSGEIDWSGRISRAGDAGVRRALYQASNVLIHSTKGWCALKSWAARVAQRRGLGKAKVALARKLAVVLHRIWTSGEVYRPRLSA